MDEKMNQILGFVRELMAGLGAREIEPADTASTELLDAARIDMDSWERDFPEVPNPSGEGTKALRTILTPSMLVALGGCRMGEIEAVRAFEIGNTYTKNYLIPTKEPFKSWNLSFGAYGEGENMDNMRGTMRAFLLNMGIGEVEFVAESEYGTYAPDQCERIVTKDPSGMEVELGIMGKFHPEVIDNFFIGCDAYGAELFLDLVVGLVASANQEPAAEGEAPASVDAAILAEEAAQLDELEQQIRALFGTTFDNDLN